MRILNIVLATAFLFMGCSSDDDSSNPATGGAGGAGASSACNEPQNPMFGSCIEAFLSGCYQPDTSGACTNDSGVTQWSDGSKFIGSGPGAGMYGPGDSDPCIDVAINNGTITATKGSEVLKYVPDSSSDTGIIFCPDGSSFTAKFEQVTTFNQCWGMDCPTGI